MSKGTPDSRKLQKLFDNLLEEIRSLQGFENFLQVPSEIYLRLLAAGGPIVVFNISDIRSDAFLITAGEIRSVHLPLLTWDGLRNLALSFFEALDKNHPSQYRIGIRKMNQVLEGLWNCGVKSILDELGFTQPPPPGQPWPRVLWVGTGLLSILPIHAAGDHDSNPPQTVLDRVVSSYAFTMKSLSYAKERAAKADQGG